MAVSVVRVVSVVAGHCLFSFDGEEETGRHKWRERELVNNEKLAQFSTLLIETTMAPQDLLDTLML